MITEAKRMNKFIHGGFTYKECKVFPGKPHHFKRQRKKNLRKGFGKNKEGEKLSEYSVIELKRVFQKAGVVTVSNAKAGQVI